MNNEEYQNLMNEIKIEEKENEILTEGDKEKEIINIKNEKNDIIDKDIAFNKLKDLQSLLKKESALK